jgi:glycosyltransferase involved in cell wall biosynthesis
LKIILLNNYNYLRGGSERVFFDETQMLMKAGHETTVFSRNNPNNKESRYSEFFPPDMKTGELGISFSALKTVKELFYSSAAKDGLKQVVDDFKPDIVHGHNVYGRLSLSVLDLLRERGIPTVLTLHDYKLLCPSYLLLNHGKVCERCKGGKFFHALLTHCHKNSYMASAVYAFESWFNHSFGKYDGVFQFISPSAFLRDKVVEFGIRPERVAHIPNAVDCKAIQPFFGPGEYLLFFGRLSSEKGVGTLLKAFRLLNGNARLLVVGDGPMREELSNIVAEDNSQVRFTGYLNGEPLKDAISGSQAVVIPSEWYENAPMSILEAIAHGKPVIGARIGGIPEMIDDGVSGLLFEPGNVEDLRDKLESFLRLPHVKIREMSIAARQKAEREYSTELHYKRLMAVYDKALGK